MYAPDLPDNDDLTRTLVEMPGFNVVERQYLSLQRIIEAHGG